MQIYEVTDPEFLEYGRVIRGIDFTQLVEALEDTPCPEGVVYVAGDPKLEALAVHKTIEQVIYGEMPVQIGYCNGHNHKLNALEYHVGSEVNVGSTDFYLILGREADVTEDFTYDTSLCKAFHVPRGVAVEVFGTSLHYAPCNKGDDGYRVAIILPLGTNLELDETHQDGCRDSHLTAKNKWLLGHPEGGLPDGSPMGLTGENLTIE